MSFDQGLFGNIEEHSLSVVMRLHVSGLCMRALLCIRVRVLQFIQTHDLTYVRIRGLVCAC